MTTADVAVVGGGPAGAAAAITLARHGLDVVVIDKARFPRDKCCGDGLTAAAIRRLEALGLRSDDVASWTAVDDVYVRSPSGRQLCFPLPRDGHVYAAIARRYDLDAALLDVARAAGAKVYEGAALRSATATHDTIHLDVDGLEDGITARYAIGADGMWSPLRKAIHDDDGGGNGAYLGEWHAFRQYFEHVDPNGAGRQLHVWFEPDLLPGYAWSFPLGGDRANVGYGILRRATEPTKHMKAQWPAILAREHIASVLGPDARPEAPHKAWPIPADLTKRPLTVAGGRVLFVGDAAAAADPLTGEGIGQALETAQLAADAIVAAGWNRPERAAAAYERAVARGLAIDNRLAALLGRAISHRKGARAALRVTGATDWTRRNFARWLFEDYPRAVLATPSRWPQLMRRSRPAQ